MHGEIYHHGELIDEASGGSGLDIMSRFQEYNRIWEEFAFIETVDGGVWRYTSPDGAWTLCVHAK